MSQCKKCNLIFSVYGEPNLEYCSDKCEKSESLLLDHDNICYGCNHYTGGGKGCNTDSICINGSINSHNTEE